MLMIKTPEPSKVTHSSIALFSISSLSMELQDLHMILGNH